MGKVRSAAPAFLFASLLIGLPTHADDPLPLVQPVSAAPVAETPQASSGGKVLAMPQVVMAVYPLRDLAAIVSIDTSDPSALRKILRESVAANDQPRFDAALARAKSVAETLPAGEERTALRQAVSVYSDLQQVWGYASADKYGAFYDDQSLPGVHARLASSYSGYAGYIGQFSLTDDRGRVLYPTAETRTFLARQAGGNVPQTAYRAPSERPAKPASSTARRNTTKPAAASAPATPVTHHKRLHKAESTPQPAMKSSPAPVKVAALEPPPAAVAPTHANAPTTAVPAPVPMASVQTPAPVAAGPAQAPAAVTPAPALTPTSTQPSSANPPAATPGTHLTEIHRAENPAVTPATPAKLAEEGATASARQTTQGILFIIVALVAIGVMTIWARTPQAASQPPQIFKPAEPLASGESPTPKKPEADVVHIKQNRAS